MAGKTEHYGFNPAEMWRPGDPVTTLGSVNAKASYFGGILL